MNPTQLERLERVQLSTELRTSLGLADIDLILWDHELGGGVVNPLYLLDPADCCPICGCLLRDNRAQDLRVCPFAPHDTPKDAA